ncbi:MAG: thioredoxin domain-containing protein [Anaerolineales bacterium]
MPNRLIRENSPYLLQHAHNPVDWYPWREEAFEKARQDDKPIFLSIGYSSCHWCHVMAHESFEDEQIAAFLNQHFVSIKVDREERPDVDSIYMSAVVGMTGHGGWPLSVFLTPEGKPFFGGTYFPPVARHGLPAFIDVLQAVQNAWATRRGEIEEATNKIIDALEQQYQARFQPRVFDKRDLEEATMRLIQTYDWQFGGWGKAPKFPQPIAIEFLIRRCSKNPNLLKARELVAHALSKMAQGGMYDLLEGGFCRYSTDNRWFVPHFEKMLYDNAQLGIVYLYAYILTKETHFKSIVEQIVYFLIKYMRDESGLFFSSMDADSDGEEGKYYTFTIDELQNILTSEEYEIFINTHHLQPLESNPQLLVFQPIEDHEALERIYDKLRKQRSTKVRPNIDDKCILSWNSFVLRFLAEASKYLDRTPYLDIATSLADAIENWFIKENTLYRIKRGKIVTTPALLEDYASTILGFLSLYEVCGDVKWFALGKQLAKLVEEKFSDQQGGFYDVSADHGQLILRPKEVQDASTPAANALALQALFKLSIFDGTLAQWSDRFIPFIENIVSIAFRYPLSFASWLILIDMILSEPKEVVLIGSQQEVLPFLDIVWSTLAFDKVLCFSDLPIEPDAPLIVQNRKKIDQQATAYLCYQGVCDKPTTDPQEFDKMLQTRS